MAVNVMPCSLIYRYVRTELFGALSQKIVMFCYYKWMALSIASTSKMLTASMLHLLVVGNLRL
jgi:hypothetical protein